MIFSEVRIVPQDRESRRLGAQVMASPYAQHQQLWMLFDRPHGVARPFLFRHRLEAEIPTFWMLTEEVPDRVRAPWKIRSREFAPRLASGDILRFELRANPTVSRRVEGRRGERVDLVGELLKEEAPARRAEARQRIVHEVLPRWLAERGSRNGFELAKGADDMPDVACHYDRWRFSKAGGAEITLGVADFSGTLRVIDPYAFLECVRSGLGHGKSFGLGMWVLRRHGTG